MLVTVWVGVDVRVAVTVLVGVWVRVAVTGAKDAVFRVLPATGVPPLMGKRGIREAVERRWTLVHKEAQRRHVMSNIVVGALSPDGCHATARTVLLVYEVGKAVGSQIHLHGMGIYDDSVVLEAGRWRFRERQLTLDRTDYFAPGWASTR